MSSKAYRANRVNDVNWEQIARGKEGLGVTVGIDVGKFDLLVVCRLTRSTTPISGIFSSVGYETVC